VLRDSLEQPALDVARQCRPVPVGDDQHAACLPPLYQLKDAEAPEVEPCEGGRPASGPAVTSCTISGRPDLAALSQKAVSESDASVTWGFSTSRPRWRSRTSSSFSSSSQTSAIPRERHVEDRVERCVQQVDKAKRRAGSTADGQHGLELPIALDKLVLESADQEKIANEKTATRQPRRGARE